MDTILRFLQRLGIGLCSVSFLVSFGIGPFFVFLSVNEKS